MILLNILQNVAIYLCEYSISHITVIPENDLFLYNTNPFIRLDFRYGFTWHKPEIIFMTYFLFTVPSEKIRSSNFFNIKQLLKKEEKLFAWYIC